MDKIIVWYGSLLFLDWWKKTIKRKLTENDLIYTELLNFKRIWSYTSDIKSLNDNKLYCWVFLDIEKDESFSINVCGLKVTDNEFDDISLREKTYDMIDITENIKNPIKWYRYFTAYLKDKNKKCNKEKVIPKKYIDFINENLKKFDKKFQNKYYSTTFWEENFRKLEWDYIFLDNDINKATWRI